MDYLKTYAMEVVTHFPEKTRDDMYAEIYDELCEEYADWEEANPGSSEAEFLESQKGHPISYATRMAPEGTNYLIGPRFYYSFISAIKVATLVVGIVFLVLAAITALASGSYIGSFIRMMTTIPGARTSSRPRRSRSSPPAMSTTSESVANEYLGSLRICDLAGSTASTSMSRLLITDPRRTGTGAGTSIASLASHVTAITVASGSSVLRRGKLMRVLTFIRVGATTGPA